MLETFAYYKDEPVTSDVDVGTQLRWIEVKKEETLNVFPGFNKVDHEFADC